MKTKTIGLVLFLVISSSVQALGFKEIEVGSFLNEPLDARIEVVSLNPAEIDGLKVSLAAPEAFRKAGLIRAALLSKLRFEVLADDKGRINIHVTTKEGVREPYLNFLLEFTSGENRLLREFTILLDPPVGGSEPARVSSSPGSAASDGKRMVISRQIAEAGDSSRQYGPVKRDETLWVIASSLKPDASVTVEQMMMALLQANPNAFLHGNVNFLRAGAVLDLPDRKMIGQLSASEARRAFFVQTDEWKALRAKKSEPARVAAETKTLVEETSAMETQPESDPTGSGGEEGVSLRVIETGMEESAGPVAEQKSEEGETTGLDEAVPDEETGSSGKELQAVLETNRDLKNLVGALELKIEALRKSLEERSRVIESLERRLSEQRPASGDGSDKTPGKAPSVDEPRKMVSAVDSSIRPEPKPVEKPVQTGSTTATPKQDWIGLAEKYWIQLSVAAFLILLLLLLLLWMRRRQTVDNQSVPESFGSYTDADDQSETEEHALRPQGSSVAQPSETRVSQGDFLPDAKADIESILAEVDIYLAYRRYGPAEALVKQAIDSHPESMVLKAKLLEIYAFRKDRKKFIDGMEKVARPMIARSPEIWAKVVEIGQGIAPDHQLIAGSELSEEDADVGIDNFAIDDENKPGPGKGS